MKNQGCITALILVASALITVGASCPDSENQSQGAKKQEEATERLHAEAYRQVGMPGVDNFQELRIMKQIIELRDQQLTTYTYTVDRDAELSFLCPSLGYGLPYSTQMTSPKTAEWRDWGQAGGGVMKPQPEPNGLYMPDNVAATWVLCQNPESGGVAPVYSEPDLIVSPFPLEYEKKYADGKDVKNIVDTKGSK